MGGEDLDVVRQLEQLAVDALVELLRERGFGALSEQIGPADAAREERIAGEHEPGLGPARVVGDQERDAVRRVPRRVQDGDPHVTKVVRLPIVEAHVGERDGGRRVDEHGRAGHPREALRPGGVIRLEVGLEDVRDPHVLLGGGLDVGLDVLLWIHHSAAGCAPSAEEIAGATGLRGQELTEDHGRLLLPGLGEWVAPRYR